MNKYILIKEYPDSPPLNTIVKLSTVLTNAYKYLDEDNICRYSNRKKIENFPEYWQKLYVVNDGQVIETSIVHAKVKDADSLFTSGTYMSMIKDYKADELYINLNNLKKVELKSLIHYVIKADGKLKDSNTNAILFSINCPKQYWIMVLQEIADDLNEGWEIDWTQYESFYTIAFDHQSNKYKVISWNTFSAGLSYFRNKPSADKAIEIMGVENLDKIFKS